MNSARTQTSRSLLANGRRACITLSTNSSCLFNLRLLAGGLGTSSSDELSLLLSVFSDDSEEEEVVVEVDDDDDDLSCRFFNLVGFVGISSSEVDFSCSSSDRAASARSSNISDSTVLGGSSINT